MESKCSEGGAKPFIGGNARSQRNCVSDEFLGLRHMLNVTIYFDRKVTCMSLIKARRPTVHHKLFHLTISTQPWLERPSLSSASPRHHGEDSLRTRAADEKEERYEEV
jgi:hypothetical protein